MRGKINEYFDWGKAVMLVLFYGRQARNLNFRKVVFLNLRKSNDTLL